VTIPSTEPGQDPVQEVTRIHQAWLKLPTCGDLVDNLMQHLHTAIPFYRDISEMNLTELPIVDRILYQTRGKKFRPARSMAPHLLTSSGSTGEPLTVTLDDASWYAVNYHFFAQVSKLAGMPADAFWPGEVAVLFVSNKPNRGSFVKPLPGLNYALYVRAPLAAHAADVAALYDRLRAGILYGKPTYLLDLRSALLESGLIRPPWSPRLLLVSGEPLHRDDRTRLTDYFEVPVVDALASTEGGLIAATRPDSDTYEVFADNVRLEVLTEDGTVCTSGVGELLLTNLVYRDTVFARYRTGDRAELQTAEADGAQRLLRLWGREPQSVCFRTGQLTTELLTDRLGFLPGMGDFQLVTENAERALLRWMQDSNHAQPDALHRALRAAIQDLLPDEDVMFERCDRITPVGGKKRRFR
jgi:phenylacetate-coenzyme A ligase PaaK-like adenylate-forming protein